jgi:hypothetical protein
LSFDLDRPAGSGNVLTLNSISSIWGQTDVGGTPEPSTFALLESALAGLAALRFRKVKRS